MVEVPSTLVWYIWFLIFTSREVSIVLVILLGLNPSGIGFCEWWDIRGQIYFFTGGEAVAILLYLSTELKSHFCHILTSHTFLGSLFFSNDTCQSWVNALRPSLHGFAVYHTTKGSCHLYSFYPSLSNFLVNFKHSFFLLRSQNKGKPPPFQGGLYALLSGFVAQCISLCAADQDCH